jgi:hypothetical protein
MRDEEFRAKLREDMLQTRARRSQLHLAKVTAIGTIATAGTLLKGAAGVPMIAYLAPLIALAFDLLICGESFTLRRMRQFVLWYGTPGSAEQDWEEFVGQNRERFAVTGNFTITAVTVGGSITSLLTQSAGNFFHSVLNILWLAGVLALFGFGVYIERRYLPMLAWQPLSGTKS